MVLLSMECPPKYQILIKIAPVLLLQWYLEQMSMSLFQGFPVREVCEDVLLLSPNVQNGVMQEVRSEDV